jgi:hypothetical protein
MSFNGWTIEYVEQMLDGPQLLRLTGFLARNPPVHLMLKGFMGIETEDFGQSLTVLSEDERRQNFVEAFAAACG